MALLLCAGTSSSVCVLKVGLANLGSEAEGGVRANQWACACASAEPPGAPWGTDVWLGVRDCVWSHGFDS